MTTAVVFSDSGVSIMRIHFSVPVHDLQRCVMGFAFCRSLRAAHATPGWSAHCTLVLRASLDAPEPCVHLCAELEAAPMTPAGATALASMRCKFHVRSVHEARIVQTRRLSIPLEGDALGPLVFGGQAEWVQLEPNSQSSSVISQPELVRTRMYALRGASIPASAISQLQERLHLVVDAIFLVS